MISERRRVPVHRSFVPNLPGHAERLPQEKRIAAHKPACVIEADESRFLTAHESTGSDAKVKDALSGVKHFDKCIPPGIDVW